VLAVILCLFLISVGALELILWQDRKNQRDSGGERESAWHTALPMEAVTQAATPPVTNDLLSLMRAVNGEISGVESPLHPPAIEAVAELSRGSDSTGLVETTANHNQV